MDVRDGVAWSSLDKYIKNIEGVTPDAASTLQPHSSHPEAAAAITAAGMADTEEDVGAVPGMPLAILQHDVYHRVSYTWQVCMVQTEAWCRLRHACRLASVTLCL